MTRYDPSVTLIRLAAAVALLVFGLRLLAPVPVSGQVDLRTDEPAVLLKESGAGTGSVSLQNAVYVPHQGKAGTIPS